MAWLVKGLFVGTVTFLFLSLLLIIALFVTTTAQAIGITVIYYYTIQNPLYWLALFLVLVAACAFFKPIRYTIRAITA